MPGGRPTSLTPEVQKLFIRALKRCFYVETAGAYCGLCRKTVRNWLRRGRREPDTIYGEFVRAIEKAESYTEVDCLSAIKKIGKGSRGRPGQWTALAWLLERSRPERWGDAKKLMRAMAEKMKEMAGEIEALRTHLGDAGSGVRGEEAGRAHRPRGADDAR
jgi:hypothetical protein